MRPTGARGRRGLRSGWPCRCAGLGLALVQLGCGIGAGQQIQQVSLHGGGSGASADPTRGTAEASLRMNTLSLVDAWGVLISIIASHENAVNARDEAVREAVENGAVNGDEIDYSYAFVPPRPGVLSTVRVAWGDDSGAHGTVPFYDEETPPAAAKGNLSAFEFDFTTGLALWGFEDCCNVGVTLSAVYQSWESTALRLDATRIAMPLGLSVGRDLFERVHLAVVGRYDVLSLLGMWLNEHWLDYSVGAQLNVVLVPWLQLQFDASRAQVATSDGDGWGDVWQAGGSLMVMFSGFDD